MAALVEGQQYGLSSQGNFSNNKTLIFVKLTDSAIRAIEDCIKYQVSSSPKPTIQFQSNQGVISIPRPSSPNSKQSFGFSLSNIDADGPQGSFECLQQSGSRSLQSLGCMLYRMHIHANEDSYEKTKVKMAVVEQESKKNCTKVIKASGPYVGRKVKVKRSIGSIPPPKPPSPQPYTARPINKPLSTINSSNGHVNHSSNNNNVNSRQFSYNKNGNPDIMRKSYRERIIHLLALRPYKKPELLTRLMKDGVKEKDKKSLGVILSQVATLKDNTYSLARHIWNEVQDDWPFYTPEELEMMKRKKPQNLTPPNENGNHSPSTTQPGNSPALQKRPPPPPTTIYDHQPSKKQRISHYNKLESHNMNSHISGSTTKPDSSASTIMKPDSLSHSRKDLSSNGYVRNNWNNSLKSDLISQKSPLSENNSHSRTNNATNGMSLHGHSDLEKNHKNWPVLPNSRFDSTYRPADSSQNYLSSRRSPDSNTHHHTVSSNHEIHSKMNGYKEEERHNKIRRPKVSSTTNGSGSGHSTPVSSPESRDSLDSKDSNSHNYSPITSNNDIPEYMKTYVVISNGEQRARYKADFNTEYTEYLNLHSAITSVSNKFAALDDSFHRSKKGSDEWHRIRNQILKEYEESQKDRKYQDAKCRFLYLHDKLSHIKRLVAEYDQATQTMKS
ncbi:RNA polymerase II elongation factor ELL [Centruroides vittatus]|uniref:RNA polymerase II elongation factor ELL n=1 Tax=Centruroides vittatus TaxID=120091 RepID=UPI00350ECF20